MSEHRHAAGQRSDPGYTATAYIAADAASSLIAFVGLWVLVRHLSVEEFGLADWLRTAGVSLTPLISLNVFASASRFYFETADGDRRRRVLGTGLTAQCAASILGGLLLMACQPLIQRFVYAGLTPGLVSLVAMSLPPMAVVAALAETAVLKRSVLRYVGLTAGQSLLNLVAVLVFVVWRRGGLAGYLLGLLGAATATAAAGSALTARDFRPGWFHGRFRAYVTFGGPYTLATATQYGYMVLLRTALVRLASPQALGLYAIAERVQQPLTMAAAAVGRTWVPWLLSEPRSSDAGLREAARRLNGIVLLVLSGLLLFMPQILVFVGGARYGPAYTAAVLLLVANWLYFVGDWLVSAGLFVSKRIYHAAWVFLLAYGIAAALAVSVVPVLGSAGAALSVLTASVIILTAMTALGRVIWPVDLGLGRLLGGSLLTIAVVALAAVGFSLALKLMFFAALVAAFYVMGWLPSPLSVRGKGVVGWRASSVD